MNKLQTATNKVYFAQTRQLFHCQCKIKIPLLFGEHVLDDCFALMEAADLRYNSYQKGSYFEQINRYAGSWVEVDETTIDTLRLVKRVSSLTAGAYALSSMPLLRSWGFYDQVKLHVPSVDERKRLLPLVDDELIELDRNRVRIQQGQELITGSFAKAIAVDRVIAFLAKQGVTDAIVNAGGSTISALNDDTHPQWHIRVPDAVADVPQDIRLPLANSCFSLSGKSNNHVVIDHNIYGHIIHGKTGWPAATRQVLLRTADAFLGDVLSTAIFAVAPEDRDKTLANLAQEYAFHYRRTEENGEQIQSACF